MAQTDSGRRYSAYDNSEARHHAHTVDASGFLDAALTYVERWGGAHEQVSVTVVDCETGEQQCFRIDLEAGEAAPC